MDKTGGLSEEQIYGRLYDLDKSNPGIKASVTVQASAAKTNGYVFKGNCNGCGKKGHKHNECHKFPYPAKDPKLDSGSAKGPTARSVKAEEINSIVAKAVSEALASYNKGAQNYMSAHLIDSAASHSMTPDRNLFLETQELHDCNVKLADGQTILKATHIGIISLPLGNGRSVQIPNVLLVPGLEEALISCQDL